MVIKAEGVLVCRSGMAGDCPVSLGDVGDQPLAVAAPADVWMDGQKQDVAVSANRPEGDQLVVFEKQVCRRPPVGIRKKAASLFEHTFSQMNVFFQLPGGLDVVGLAGLVDAFFDGRTHCIDSIAEAHINSTGPQESKAEAVMSEAPESQPMSYTLCAHTADIAVEATAPDLDGLFESVADGLAAAMCESVPADGDRFECEVRAESAEALLYEYLDQLIYERDVRLVLPVDNAVDLHEQADGWHLSASARGVPLAEVDAREIKAVTYSEMELEQRDDGWYSYVVFDV